MLMTFLSRIVFILFLQSKLFYVRNCFIQQLKTSSCNPNLSLICSRDIHPWAIDFTPWTLNLPIIIIMLNPFNPVTLFSCFQSISLRLWVTLLDLWPALHIIIILNPFKPATLLSFPSGCASFYFELWWFMKT